MPQRSGWVKPTPFCQMMILVSFLLLFIINSLYFSSASEINIVRTLPGYSGTLPFKLETGYISIGENEEIELFYYFIESESEPERDPLLLWLNGGPGCSGLLDLVYEIGPFTFDISAFDGSLPSFILNPYSWTKVANIIFIDSPVGAGFSYAATANGYVSYDNKWLLKHPSFINNRLYVAGDTYGGKIVPMVSLEIARGNEAGLEPQMLLQGYMVGNPVIGNKEANEKIPYAHRMALISDEYFELAKHSCNGEYVTPDWNNYQCHYALRLIQECTNLITEEHILEPKCEFLSPKPDNIKRRPTFLKDHPVRYLLQSKQEEPWCRNHNYMTSYVWANDETVREALHIRQVSCSFAIREYWTRCNQVSYDKNVESVIKYHQLLNNKGYQALVYSGDHDMRVPYMNTLNWIRSLNLTIDDQWRPWTVNGQVAGYTEKYKSDQAYITFATVKVFKRLGAGHTAPEYMPKQCLAMINRWLSREAL
ncbi:hypothetical protein ACJIZ3_001246 [Penstemon smallii]|uniref:Uncharacterized protein n=1 Tax=Penstemon smallii TaxID=265156 RepID=A0ABD3U6M1_9LAMI